MPKYVRWRLWTSHFLEKLAFGVGVVSLVAAVYSAVLGDWFGSVTLAGFSAVALVLFLVPWFGRGLKPEPMRRSQQHR